MPENVIVDDRFIVRSPHLFEKTLLFASIKSYRFYERMKPRLCPYDEERKARRPDFKKNPHYNQVYTMVGDYWDWSSSQIPTGQDCALPVNFLEELFAHEIRNRRMAQDDALRAFEEIKTDFDLFQFMPGMFDYLANDRRVLNWLDRRAAEGLINLSRNQIDVRPLTLDQIISKAQKDKAALTESKGSVVDGADLIYSQESSAPPVATDLMGLNEALGGGLRAGGSTLVAAISGGGKSVLAMQWAVHYAKNGLNVLVFTTEQPPRELMLRGIANHLDLDYGLLMQRELPEWQQHLTMQQKLRQLNANNNLPDWVHQQYRQPLADFYNTIKPHLKFVDWSRGGTSVYADFDKEVSTLEGQGYDPGIIIFDWIGGGLESERNLGGLKLDRRLLYKEAMDTITRHAKRFNRIAVSFAQLDKVLAGPKKTWISPDMVAECKSLIDLCDNFIGISAVRSERPHESTGRTVKLNVRQQLCVSKARHGEGGGVPVDAHFKFQRFSNPAGRLVTNNAALATA